MNALSKIKAKNGRYGVLAVGKNLLALDIDNLAEICVVQEVLPFLTGRRDVLGAINLRGMMIPLLDPMLLCNSAPMENAPKLAAIVVYKGRMLAVGVESAVSISVFSDAEIHGFYPTDRKPQVPVNGGVLAEGTTINVLEPQSFFDEPNMPSLDVKDEHSQGKEGGGDRAFLIFEAGGATFGLEAVRISGTVPRKDVDIGSLSGGDCLGTITYQGRRVPIMDATQVFGLGDRLRSKTPEFVVMRYPDDRLLGFAVDIIQQIRIVRAAETSEVPDIFGASETLFSSVLSCEKASHIFLLNAEAITGHPPLLHMSTLSDGPPKAKESKTQKTSSTDGSPAASAEVWNERHRCIVFTAGFQISAKITDVVSILPTPETVTPIRNCDPAILGLFAYEKSTVPLVSLTRSLAGCEPQDHGFNRVLLVGPQNRRVGFLVDSVDGIETSEYLAVADGNTRVTERIAKLRSKNIKTVLPFADLDALSSQIVLPAK